MVNRSKISATFDLVLLMIVTFRVTFLYVSSPEKFYSDNLLIYGTKYVENITLKTIGKLYLGFS